MQLWAISSSLHFLSYLLVLLVQPEESIAQVPSSVRIRSWRDTAERANDRRRVSSSMEQAANSFSSYDRTYQRSSSRPPPVLLWPDSHHRRSVHPLGDG